MYGDGIGKLQFLKLLERIGGKAAIFELYFCGFCKLIDFLQDSHITVKNADSFLDHDPVSSADLPFHLVVILYLHHLIPLTEQTVPDGFFLLCLFRRIQISLQNLVQAFHTKKALPHRSQNLNFKWFGIYIFREFLLDQCDHYTYDNVCIISFQKKEIPAFVIDLYRFPTVDLMRIYDNIALRSLTENLGQLYYRKASAVNDISQHISRSYTWKLILISDQDQPGSCGHCQKQGMHQMNVYHGHLVNNDHICFQWILCISLKFR